ncbi:MAG: hypothetical protein M1368_07320, partial [Thaumarchaeota archaeon]|nr:hypothetical protein [Nitrososphaerota archaeon]
MPRKILLIMALLAFFFLSTIVAGRTGTVISIASLNLQQQSTCSSTVTVSSAFGATSGSGSYACGSIVTFGVSPTAITEGEVRHVFSVWTCSGPGCYSGSANLAWLTTGGNNSVTTETALWSTEYLLTVSSNPSNAGRTDPHGSVWKSAGSVVSVSPQPSASGWFFAYWSVDSLGNAGSSDTYTITMDSPHSVTANFVKLNVTTQLLNVTSVADGLVMRNPDGTFYRGDVFQISSGISVVGGGLLPGNVIPLVKYSFPEVSVVELSSSNETHSAEFQILDSAPYSDQEVTATGYLYNEIGNVLVQSPSFSPQPFTVVQYHPIFSYFTYMEYNNLSSSTYARPFVTLVRYDGNVPGYSYAGDANTDPFRAYNSTMERAFLNNFTLSVEGWSVSTNQINPASSLSVVSYNAYEHLNVGIEMLNKSYPSVITWSQREWKFYFLANLSSIRAYIANDGIIYFNVSETAWYLHDATLHYSEFNTSYLYEPLFYNGYLIFKAAENDLSSAFTVSVVAHNPDPLNQYLIQQVKGIFGNDPQVIDSFEQDLYAAYSSTMVLKPCFANATEEVFLVNQTNIIMTPQSLGEVPYFTISVSGVSGTTTYQYDASNPPSYLGEPLVSYDQARQNITYNVDDEYSLFAMNDFSPPAPFQDFTGYFLAQSSGYEIVMQPTSFSFGGPASYLV